MRGALSAICGALLAAGAAAAPLSAIDWLKRDGAANDARRDAARGGAVDVAPLGEPEADAAGLFGIEDGGVPLDFWDGLAAADAVRLIEAVAGAGPEAQRRAFHRILISRARAPEGAAAADALLAARIDALVRIAAVEDGRDLLRQSGARGRRWRDRALDLAILEGRARTECAEALADSSAPPAPAIQTFCRWRVEPESAARLTFATYRALGALAPLDAALYGALLEDGEPPALARGDLTPARADALRALGGWPPGFAPPLAYALATREGDAPPRARLEAAERLAAEGLDRDARLAALIAAFEPAVSGGVWGRAAGVRRFAAAAPDAFADAFAKLRERAAAAGLTAAYARIAAVRIAAQEPAPPAPAIAAWAALGGDDAAAALWAPRGADAVIDAALWLRAPRDRDPPPRDALGGVKGDAAARAAALIAALDPPRPTPERADAAAALGALAALDAPATLSPSALAETIAALAAAGFPREAREAAAQILLVSRAR